MVELESNLNELITAIFIFRRKLEEKEGERSSPINVYICMAYMYKSYHRAYGQISGLVKLQKWRGNLLSLQWWFVWCWDCS